MGRRQAAGPLTEFVATELRAQRGRLKLTYEALAERAGLSKGAVHAALQGEQAIALEVYGALCKAMNMDAGDLFAAAVQASSASTPQPAAADAPDDLPDWLTLAANTDPSPTDRERFEAEMGDWDPA